MKRQTIAYSTIVIVGFLISYFGRGILSGFVELQFSTDYSRIAYSYLWWFIPMVLITGLLYGFRDFSENMGVLRGFLKGLLFSGVTVLPMFLGSAVMGEFDCGIRVFDLINKTVVAGFMEEALFRGFLFGLLFRKLNWGFLPAALLGAFVFGFGHIYQGHSFMESLGVFFITALGAVWFAWLYIEWDNNLWVPIFLHVLMNLSWALFDVSDTALGGIYANLFRVISIALTIILTIKINGAMGLKINRRNLMVNAARVDNPVPSNT
jgi:membrane protease YdiL (CAAX protease family)